MPQLTIAQERDAQNQLLWHEYFDAAPPHRVHRIPALRLLITLVVGPEPRQARPDVRRTIDALLDTGAPISVFPHAVWSRFPPDAYQLLNPANVPPGQVFRTGRVVGAEYQYQYGRVWLGVIDTDGRRLRAVPVVGQFMQPGHTLARPVVGLSGGVLTGRVLFSRYAATAPFEHEWWLQEG